MSEGDGHGRDGTTETLRKGSRELLRDGGKDGDRELEI